MISIYLEDDNDRLALDLKLGLALIFSCATILAL